MKKVLLSVCFSLAGCGTGVYTGVDAVDGLTDAKKTCYGDFKFENQSSKTLTFSAEMHDRIMDAHCNGFQEGSKTVPAGESASLHFELQCRKCTPGMVYRGTEVQDQTNKRVDGFDETHIVCTDSGCGVIHD